MDTSIARDDTVRMAVTDSDAIDALVESRLAILASSRPSKTILMYPQPTTAGMPARTISTSNFQLYTRPRTLQAAMFTPAMITRPMFKPICLFSVCGCVLLWFVCVFLLFL